jgi:hypothetical protein
MTTTNREENTESTFPMIDLFAFTGVRQIIGDVEYKLMQTEVADRIEKLVRVLQNVAGLVDALEVLSGTHKGTANSAMREARMRIIEALDESMPEWDAVLESIHNSNNKWL